MILSDDLIPFLLHLESYMVYVNGHKLENCHQLRLLVVNTWKQACVAFSDCAGISSAVACKKGNWTIGRIG